MPKGLVLPYEAAEEERSETRGGIAEQTRESVRRYAGILRKIAEITNQLSEAIRSGWFELRDEDQDRLIGVLHRLEKSDEKSGGENSDRQVIDLAQTLVPAEIFQSYQKDLIDYIESRRRFAEAIAGALADEERRLQVTEESISSNPDTVAEIERSSSDSIAGKGIRMNQKEFLKRFSWM